MVGCLGDRRFLWLHMLMVVFYAYQRLCQYRYACFHMINRAIANYFKVVWPKCTSILHVASRAVWGHAPTGNFCC